MVLKLCQSSCGRPPPHWCPSPRKTFENYHFPEKCLWRNFKPQVLSIPWDVLKSLYFSYSGITIPINPDSFFSSPLAIAFRQKLFFSMASRMCSRVSSLTGLELLMTLALRLSSSFFKRIDFNWRSVWKCNCVIQMDFSNILQSPMDLEWSPVWNQLNYSRSLTRYNIIIVSVLILIFPFHRKIAIRRNFNGEKRKEQTRWMWSRWE